MRSTNEAKIGSSGYAAKIGSSGDAAKIGSSGDEAIIKSIGKRCVIMCAGEKCTVSGMIGSWITLTEWEIINGEKVPVCVKTVQIDGKNIKADTPYKLINGEFVEVT